MRIINIMAVILMALMLLVATGCGGETTDDGGNGDNMQGQQEETGNGDSAEVTDVDLDSDGGTITVEGEDGEVIEYEIDKEGDSGSMTITGEDGEVEIIYEEGQLPEGWPDDVPIMPGLSVEGGVSHVMDASDASSSTVVFSGDVTLEAVVDFYEDVDGWDSTTSFSMLDGEDPGFMIMLTQDERMLMVAGGMDDEKVMVTISYGEE